MDNSTFALEAVNITKTFAGARGIVKAVDGVSFVIERGANVGIVGESGCGKSTLARALTRLQEPDSGEIYLYEKDTNRSLPFHDITGAEFARARRKIQLIFQDPGLALDPRLRIINIIEEALEARGVPRGAGRTEECYHWLSRVALPRDAALQFPRALSGGERQRVAIARALAAEPSIIILDESTASLDVSVRAGILQLLLKLQKELKLSYLWISHDLRLVLSICNKIAVMRDGRFIEELDATKAGAGQAKEPYTKILLKAAGVENG